MSNSSDFTVFIIDDDDAVRHSLCLMIEQEGFNVQTFENAENFLKIIHASPMAASFLI